MRCAAAIVVASWLVNLVTPLVLAQSPANLPAGIISVEVADQAISPDTTPVVSDAAPQIAGRVELGAPTITLSLTGETALQFPAEVDNRGRFRVVVPERLADGLYTLAINDLPLGSFEVRAGAAPADRAPGPLLDIARVVPYPADFGNAIPGIGFLDGRFYTIKEEAARTATADGEPTTAVIRDLERRLAESGWLQRYESRLAAPSQDDPTTFRVQFSSYVVEYASGENAQAAYTMLRGEGEAVDAPLVGEESTLTLFSGVTPDTGTEFQAARLMFRIGPMLAVIVYADLVNEQPDLALLDTVAQNVAGRAAVVAGRDTVPLGSMILRPDPATATDRLARRDLYDVRAGTLTTLFGEDDATRADRIAVFTGTTDAFSSTTNGSFAAPAEGRRGASQEAAAAAPTPTSVILVEGESPSAPATPAATSVAVVEEVSAQVFMTSSLYAFPGPTEADVWLTSQEATLASDATSETGFERITEGPNFGEASATFAIEQPVPESGESARGFRIYTRVGEIVAVVEFASSPGVQLNGVARLMRMQVDCIVDNGCTGLAPLPESIFGGQDEPVAAEPRRTRSQQQPTPVPTPEPAPAVIAEPPITEEVVPVEEAPPPVEEVPEAPVEEPAPPEEVPVEEPTPVPAEETPPPAEEPAPPAEEATPPPAAEPTPPPAEEPTQVPPEVTPAPVEEPTPAPVEEPTPAPVEESPPAPVEEPTLIPTPAPDTGVDEGGNGRDDRDRRNRRDRDRRGNRD